MSFLSDITNKILHPVPAGSPPAPAHTADASPPAAAPAAAPAPQASSPSVAPAAGKVDVAAVLDALNAKQHQNLNWRQSIVDLLKLLNMDSGLDARKKMATELHYTGNMDDSATMNVWLHRQVVAELAANGGVLPSSNHLA